MCVTISQNAEEPGWPPSSLVFEHPPKALLVEAGEERAHVRFLFDHAARRVPASANSSAAGSADGDRPCHRSHHTHSAP